MRKKGDESSRAHFTGHSPLEQQREGEKERERERKRELGNERKILCENSREVVNRTSSHENERNCESIVRHTLKLSPALRPTFNKAIEGNREWDSPSAMLKLCARLLAFSPTVYRLATDTLVLFSPPTPALDHPPFCSPIPSSSSGMVSHVRAP